MVSMQNFINDAPGHHKIINSVLKNTEKVGGIKGMHGKFQTFASKFQNTYSLPPQHNYFAQNRVQGTLGQKGTALAIPSDYNKLVFSDQFENVITASSATCHYHHIFGHGSNDNVQ